MVKPIYKVLGYKVGNMKHAALFLSHDKKQESCAKNVPKLVRVITKKEFKINIIKIGSFSKISKKIINKIDYLNENNQLSKTSQFIEKRYFKHPWYDYNLLLISEIDNLECILVIRKVSSPFGNIFRIVDLFGNYKVLKKCFFSLREFLYSEKCDYIDMVYSGIDDKILTSGGFLIRTKNKKIVLPNYFSPFIQKNVTLSYAYKNFSDEHKNMIFFRGDSDQDRPNSLEEINRKKLFNQRTFLNV